MIADIESKKSMIEKFALTTPDRYWHYLHHLIPNNPFLVCALDMAAWDLFGKMHNSHLYKLWNTQWKNIPLTDYTIGIDSIEKMIEKMQQHPSPIIKLKLEQRMILKQLKHCVNTQNATLRVDANARWTLSEALAKIPALKSLGVELVEQPLAKDNFNDMKILFEQSSLHYLLMKVACLKMMLKNA